MTADDDAKVIPFPQAPGPEAMVQAVEEALRRMWGRVEEEPMPERIVSLLAELDEKSGVKTRS